MYLHTRSSRAKLFLGDTICKLDKRETSWDSCHTQTEVGLRKLLALFWSPLWASAWPQLGLRWYLHLLKYCQLIWIHRWWKRLYAGSRLQPQVWSQNNFWDWYYINCEAIVLWGVETNNVWFIMESSQSQAGLLYCGWWWSLHKQGRLKHNTECQETGCSYSFRYI